MPVIIWFFFFNSTYLFLVLNKIAIYSRRELDSFDFCMLLRKQDSFSYPIAILFSAFEKLKSTCKCINVCSITYSVIKMQWLSLQVQYLLTVVACRYQRQFKITLSLPWEGKSWSIFHAQHYINQHWHSH